MQLETKRLFLRPWLPSDAESLYEYAKDPAVGPIAGWPPHTSVENSRQIILDVLSADEIYAVCQKEDNRAIGSIGLMIGSASNLNLTDTEGEIGYWIGVPFWGKGLIPEAAKELIRHGFEDLKLEKIWCGYFDGNIKSKRVQEKCGFVYHHINKNIHWELMDDIRTEHITCLTRDNFIHNFLPNQDISERFTFRNIRLEEAQQAAEIERICFPPKEACSKEMMLERTAKAPELFLVAIDRHTGKIAGFLNGLSTEEDAFRDEFFTDASLYDPKGKNIMLLGLDVLPQYRGQGLARELMQQYLRRESKNGRNTILLTCVQSKVKMYEKMGFHDKGIANSAWGGNQWHEMSYSYHGN